MSNRRAPRTSANTTRARQTRQAEMVANEPVTLGTLETPDTLEVPAPTRDYYELAVEALADGWTREQVIGALIGRIHRDTIYLAYRKACHRRTSYDRQVQQDMRALSLAAVWLETGQEDLDAHAAQPASKH